MGIKLIDMTYRLMTTTVKSNFITFTWKLTN